MATTTTEPTCDGKFLFGQGTTLFMHALVRGTPAGEGGTPPASADYLAAEVNWSKVLRLTKITPPAMSRDETDIACLESLTEEPVPAAQLTLGEAKGTVIYVPGSKESKYVKDAMKAGRIYGAWIRYKNGTSEFFKMFVKNFEPDEVSGKEAMMTQLTFRVLSAPVDTKPADWPALTDFNDFNG